MTIVLAGLPHARLMSAIHKVCFAEPWDEAAIAGLLRLPGHFGLVWDEGAAGPVALLLARAVADEGEILSVAVLPPFRKRGIGQRLLRHAADHVRAAGAKVLFLEAAANNQAALSLYSGLGFVECGRRPRYYADGTDAILLRLEL